FDFAAKAIGFAIAFDGLDGAVARMTHTSSDFGRELDSLADVITFGVAPALLAYRWGFHSLPSLIFFPTFAPTPFARSAPWSLLFSWWRAPAAWRASTFR